MPATVIGLEKVFGQSAAWLSESASTPRTIEHKHQHLGRKSHLHATCEDRPCERHSYGAERGMKHVAWQVAECELFSRIPTSSEAALSRSPVSSNGNTPEIGHQNSCSDAWRLPS